MKESGENYLLAIYNLGRDNGKVRAVDIAGKLGFAKPSVSRALKLLKERGLITVGAGGAIAFTPEGETTAKEIAEKEDYVTQYLIRILHLEEDIAVRDAPKLRYAVSPEAYYEIKNAVNRHKKMFDYRD